VAADDYNATTGAPEFSGSGTPETAADLTEVAAFAASVGTRLIGTTAERTAYDHAREGLEWWDTDLDTLYVHNGSGWETVFKDWAAYTPTTVNFTGTVVAEYQVVGKTVNVRIRATLSAALGGQPTFSLPVTASNANPEPLGMGWLNDANGTEYPAFIRKNSATTAAPYTINAASTNALLANTTASIPFTWASGDIIHMNFSYRAA